MKSLVFYLLFYFYPIARTIFTVARRICAFLSIIMLIETFYDEFSIDRLLAATMFFAASLGALILQQKYTTLLLKLQPEDTEYSFYS